MRFSRAIKRLEKGKFLRRPEWLGLDEIIANDWEVIGSRNTIFNVMSDN